MKYMALYRKYRPRVLDEVYGQNYVVDIVKNSVLNDRIFHAYLFSGPRGTGKTTVAKLIAKIVNCFSLDGYDPCDVCDSCRLFDNNSNPDIVEIDAASNNGVDEIRLIRENIVLMPSVSKYRVYIIDEVHMLSTSAFNALLKTLEEPPKHVVFILATTEIDRIPETIVSRCQCLDFKRISVDDIVLCLESICDKEGIVCNRDVLMLIAEYCNGGMRDSVGLLDKLASYSNNITKDLFYDVVGLVKDDVLYQIFDNLINNDVNGIFDVVEKMVNSGKSVEMIVEQMLSFIRKNCLKTDGLFSENVFSILLNGVSDIFSEVRFSVNKLLCFEIGILKIVNKLNDDKNISREIKFNNDTFSGGVIVDNRDDVEDVKPKREQMVDVKCVDFDIVINNAFSLANKNLKATIVEKWNGFNDYVHNKEFSSLVSYFLDSSVQVVGEKDIIISVPYSSIVDNARNNLAKLELLFNLVMGRFYNLAFVVEDDWKILKEKYISDIKMGKSYKYIEQKEEKDDIISVLPNDDSLAVSTAKDMFGDDIVVIN